MMNLKSGTILTNGLGGPAFNLLTFGPFNLYIEPITTGVTPTPTPSVSSSTGVTPTPTPTAPVSPTPFPDDFNQRPGGAGGGSAYDETDLVYKIHLTVKITKRKTVTREFIVDKRRKDFIVRRIGTINMVVQKFNTVFKGIKRKIKFKWKK